MSFNSNIDETHQTNTDHLLKDFHENNHSEEEIDSKFLFIKKPTKLESECIFDIPLKTGVLIIGIIHILHGLQEFTESYVDLSALKAIYEFCISLGLIISGILCIYSVLSASILFLKWSYIIGSILFIFETVNFCLLSLYDLFMFFNFGENNFLNVRIILAIFMKGGHMIVWLYFLWIMYCYLSQLKMGLIVDDF